MGQFAIAAACTPKPRQQQGPLQAVARHLPLLRGEGRVTERPACAMRAADDTIVEVFEWASAEAIWQAHHNAAVQALWAEFGACHEYRALASLVECQWPFPVFEAVALWQRMH